MGFVSVISASAAGGVLKRLVLCGAKHQIMRLKGPKQTL